MADRQDRPPPEANEFEREFQRPLTRPETDEGVGPTLGQDLSVAREREEDRRHGARDIQDDVERG